ncbi:MAG TPA: DUF3616 domain-containing protein [Pyrinomonadaceae bacterium]|nr:DUF3616 domain-containing protein [Pyrinomonadaceae bacterium]
MLIKSISLGIILLFAVAVASVFDRAPHAAAPQPMTAFSGGTFEASGVAHVPGTAGVLFVDDGRPNEIFWLPLGEDRKQAGAIKTINIATSIIDLEGITSDGMYFYVVGSQSKGKGADQTGLARFTFDAANQRAAGTQAATGLKKFLADNVAELRGMENTKYNDGGINVEGIAWDPQKQRLLLGLRSPVVEGHALVVPLKMRDPKAPLSFENLEVEGNKAIRLPLGGAGIRSIEFDDTRKAFHLITGAGPNSEKMDFKLWEWSGNSESPTLREIDTFDRRLKPEGITRVSKGAEDFIFIVFDTSRYTATD